MTMTNMPDSFQLSAKEIDGILASPDSFTAQRLMQRYETASNKTAFVAALIGKVLLNRHRGGHADLC
jgi:hypothetical protein